MSTPTPIEIVREMQLWRRAQGKYGLDEYPPGMPFSPRQYGEAIDSVLRDAERYKALERAFEKHGNEGMVTVMRWKGQRVWHYTKEPEIDGSTLAELAGRLKGTQ